MSRRPTLEFLKTEASSGLILAAAALAALILANSPWASDYFGFIHAPFSVRVGPFEETADVLDWVKHGLMAVFFFVVGLEIGREHRSGELGHLRTAVVPVVGAAGGMAGAGLVYVLFNHGGAGSSGWGIPMATDIAFALGALALLGRRVPPGLRLLLLTLAVADDVGSVVVLAVFYSSRTRPAALVAALVVAAAMVASRRWPRAGVWPVLVGGVAVWVLLAAGGVEPALAGVVAGVLVPSSLPGRGDRNPAELLERRVAPVSAFGVLPLFALANAGIVLHAGMLAPSGATAVFVGVAAARVAGKLVGITLACYVVVRLGLGRLPEGVLWSHVAGGAAVAGIGFTVPLLIAEQAFATDPALVAASELGLLVGSAVAFGVGALLLMAVRRRMDWSDALSTRTPTDGRDDAHIPW